MNQHTPVAAASVQHQPSQQKQIVQRAAHSQTAGVHSIPSPLEVSLDTKLELIRTSIPWLVEILSTRTFQEPTNHNNNSQQVLTRLIRPVSTYSFNKACLRSLVLPQLAIYQVPWQSVSLLLQKYHKPAWVYPQ